jgi:hypothetical protein
VGGDAGMNDCLVHPLVIAVGGLLSVKSKMIDGIKNLARLSSGLTWEVHL